MNDKPIYDRDLVCTHKFKPDSSAQAHGFIAFITFSEPSAHNPTVGFACFRLTGSVLASGTFVHAGGGIFEGLGRTAYRTTTGSWSHGICSLEKLLGQFNLAIE